MIYVVGCNHGIQPQEEDWLGGDSPAAKEQKTHFAELVKHIIEAGKIQFVGEEWGLPEITTAHALADACHIRWENINASWDDLDRLGIPRNYAKGNFTQAQKKHWDSQREHVMLRNLKENQREALNILVVCGFEHMESLASLLRLAGTVVRTVDYRSMNWHRCGVFAEDP
jgi:hypothetical protein